MNLGNTTVAFQLLASQYRNLYHDAQTQLHYFIRTFLTQKSSQNSNNQPLIQLFHQGKSNMLSLKRKLSSKFEQQYTLYDILKKRVHHQQQVKSHNNWGEQDEQNMLYLKYLQSRSRFQLVENLTFAAKYKELVEVQTILLKQAKNIIHHIRMNSLNLLINWMEKNHHQLQKINLVYFQLMICQFLNLLTEGKTIEAIILLRNTAQSMRPNEAQYKIISNMTYLLVDIQSTPPNYRYYLKLLEDAFLRAFSEIYQANFDSTLETKVGSGLSAKQTVCCSPTSNGKLYSCPICSQRPQKLLGKASNFPKQTSIFLCRINRSLMDHENYPVALPSGQIYSISGLKSTSINNKFYCMITETWYDKEEAIKIYLT